MKEFKRKCPLFSLFSAISRPRPALDDRQESDRHRPSLRAWKRDHPELAAIGAEAVLACRDNGRGKRAAVEIARRTGSKNRIDF